MPGSRKRLDLLLLGWCAVAVAIGAWLRVQNLGEPPGLGWDEHHFVRNAQNLLQGQRDLNDHPPLGKLLIAQSIHWFGDHSLSWRLPALVSGLLNIALASLLAARLFRSWRAGALAAAFVAGDGFFVAYSRAALLDGWVATFTLATACAIVRAKTAWQIALAALLMGLGCAVKFNVVVMLAPIAAVALFGRAPRWSVALLGLAPLAYFLVYRHGLVLGHQPHGVPDVMAATRALFVHHAGLTEMKHALVSSWYAWLVPTKPVAMRFSQVDGVVRSMSSMGNPLLWWAVSLTVIASAGAALSTLWERGRAKLRARPTPLSTIGAVDPGELWALCLWALPVLPWVVSRRDSYVYHYLPAYGFGVVLVAGKLARLLDERRRAGWLGAGVITLCAWWVAPVSAEIPVTRLGYELRLWLPAWRRASPKLPAPIPALSAVPPAAR
ncbi:MAG: glycosyltransferase family 39 protein [Myxococcales bacterium]|nr:glycosyltransferase family 39 protein [Myxococcales bacterium]